MGRADFFSDGRWNLICDECGHKYKNTYIKETWDGRRVCRKCWEPRNTQDFVKGVKDWQQVPFSRPDTQPTFVPVAEALEVPEE
jgi:hypothetical protein